VTPRTWTALRWTGVAALVGALVWRLGSGGLLAGLAGGLGVLEPGSVLAALAVGLLTTVCNAGRWCLVARSLGIRLSLPGAVADCYRAQFLNSVLPAGVLGDVHRAVHSGRESGDVGRGARAVVLERLAGQAVVVVVALAVLLAQPALREVSGDLVPVGGWWLAAAVAAAVAAAGWLLRARLRPWARTMATDLRGLRSPDTWPGVVVLSAGAFAGYLALFVVAARAAGSTAPVTDLLPVLVLALLAMILPITVGGWGPREAVAAVGFGAVGLGAAHGLAAAVGYGVLGMVACLPGAAVLLLRRRRTSSAGVTAGVTDDPRTPAPETPAAPVLYVPTPATADRPHPTPCTPGVLGSAGAGARRPHDRPLRSAA
jgi:uncharacterized membrane protein YbhN (UPF0104 family)